MTGTVLELFITQDNAEKKRLKVDKIFLDEFGIHNDKFYNKNLMRSVLLTSIESYQLAQDNSISIDTGSLGENILVDINPYHLKAGDRVKIGETLLEITQNCTLCKGLSSVDSKLPKLLKDDRGIFSKVVEGKNEIKIGDTIEIFNY